MHWECIRTWRQTRCHDQMDLQWENFRSFLDKYSQTCIKQPGKGNSKSGYLAQIAALKQAQSMVSTAQQPVSVYPPPLQYMPAVLDGAFRGTVANIPPTTMAILTPLGMQILQAPTALQFAFTNMVQAPGTLTLPVSTSLLSTSSTTTSNTATSTAYVITASSQEMSVKPSKDLAIPTISSLPKLLPAPQTFSLTKPIDTVTRDNINTESSINLSPSIKKQISPPYIIKKYHHFETQKTLRNKRKQACPKQVTQIEDPPSVSTEKSSTPRHVRESLKMREIGKYLYVDGLRRQRARITDALRNEIINFANDHMLLKQGEIANIFGIDRTTVTKLLKRNRGYHDTEETPVKKARRNKNELEDLIYRHIIRQRAEGVDMLDQANNDQLLEEAKTLQIQGKLSDPGFTIDHEWLEDFKTRFRFEYDTNFYFVNMNGSYESKESPGNRSRSRPQCPATSKTAATTASDAKPNVKQAAEFKGASAKQRRSSSEMVTVKIEPQDEPVVKIEPPSIEDRIEDLDDKEAMSRDLMNLEKFRKQQQFIEEANIQKKALLSKTLTERRKAAAKEAYKLEHIQKELAKLDTLLTADVNVIRSRIEDASREFMDAQRRFERAEAEYVASKMELHDKQELKEQLTEHLYAIIHQNEVRKAKKLAELMKSLEMDGAGGEGGEQEIALPELPPLTSFQPGNVLLSPTNVRQFAIHGTQGEQKPTTPDSENSKDNSPGSHNKNETNNTDDTDHNINTQSDASVDKSDNPSNIETEKLPCSPIQVDKKTDADGCDTTLSDAPENNAGSSDKIQTSNTNGRLDNPKAEINPQEVIGNQSENKQRKHRKDSSETAVDLSIVKQEVLDTEDNEKQVSKANLTAKTKWDFDGSLR